MYKYLLLFFLILGQLQAQTLPLKKVTLLLSWKHQFQFAGYYAAKELGYYKKYGIDLMIVEHNESINVTDDVANGSAQFGIGHSSLLLEAEKNIIFLAAIHQSSPLILLSKKCSYITTLEDIKYKKIMLTNDQKEIASIYAMLYAKGIKKDSYTQLKSTFNPLDIVNGYADFMVAYSANEPFTLQDKGINFTIFNPKDYGYDFYADILFTSKKTLQNDPKLVDTFRVASLEGWKYAYTHIPEVINIILKNYNTQNRTYEALLFEANTLKKLALKKDTNLGDINPNRLQEIATTYRLLGYDLPVKKMGYNALIYNPLKDFKFFLDKKEDKSSFIYNLLHNKYFKISFITLSLFVFLFLLLEYRMQKLLKKKTAEIKLKNEIFDKNICSANVSTLGVITFVSDAYCKLSGYRSDELVGEEFRKVRDTQTPKKFYQDLWITIISGHNWSGEIKNIKKNGDPYWINVVISPVFDKDNNILSFNSIVHDITAQKILHEFNDKLQEEVKKKTLELEKLATTDKLTGINNRVKIDENLQRSYKYFVEHQENFAIIIVDIDFFKKVNDTYGHLVGDEILIEVTQIILKNIRKSDILGRWGGEEFMVILANTDIKSSVTIAQDIRKAIETYSFSRVQNLSISAGVSDILSCSSLHNIIQQADTFLYKAKESGRNIVVSE